MITIVVMSNPACTAREHHLKSVWFPIWVHKAPKKTVKSDNTTTETYLMGLVSRFITHISWCNDNYVCNRIVRSWWIIKFCFFNETKANFWEKNLEPQNLQTDVYLLRTTSFLVKHSEKYLKNFFQIGTDRLFPNTDWLMDNHPTDVAKGICHTSAQNCQDCSFTLLCLVNSQECVQWRIWGVTIC